jgi:NarL family two-component system response regulator LiaR
MSEISPIRLMIVDDHAIVRLGLRQFLAGYPDLEVVAEAEDGREAIALCDAVEPDVVLMDLVMPGMDGAAATRRIRRAHPTIQVIALTGYLDEHLVRDALEAGAIAYLLKDVGSDRLAAAIRDAHRGRGTLDSAVAHIVIRAAASPPPLGHDLSVREQQVLTLIAKGLTNRQIAERLFLSPGTVRIYVSHLLSKLGAANRTEALALALQHHLIPRDGVDPRVER